jgi:hypothetical protein
MIVAGCDVGSLTAKAFVMNEKGSLAGEIIKKNHGYEPQGKPWILIPPQGAGYYTLRLWRDCLTYKFQYTSFLKFESHNKQIRNKGHFL